MNALTESATSGRTVRTIVTSHHGEVTDAWCRRLLHQVLQSLEIQHGMRLAQRAITPDTVVVLESGDPLLLPGDDDAPPARSLAEDIQALAGVVHYAISGQYPPVTPLAGRDLPGFGPSLLRTLDQCVFGAPELRPQTGAGLRTLLAQSPLPPAPEPPPAAATDTTAAAAAPEPAAPAPAQAQLDPVAGLRVESAPTASPAPGPGVDRPSPAPTGVTRRPVWPWVAALLVLVVASWFALRYLDATRVRPAAPAQVLAPPAAPAPGPAATPTVIGSGAVETVSVGVLIKPWGTVYVDGTEIGVSPPLKALALVPGQHMVRVVNPGFLDHQRLITVTADTPFTIEHEFTDLEKRP